MALKRGSLASAGEIAWSKGQHCGVRFSTAINVGDWVDRAGPVGQQRIDATIADYRKGGALDSGRLARARRRDLENVVDFADDLLKVCERLAALPDMSVALAEELIRIEAVATALAEIGKDVR